MGQYARMRKTQTISSLIYIALSFVAVVACGFLLITGRGTVPALLGVVLVLAAAQLMLFVVLLKQDSKPNFDKAQSRGFSEILLRLNTLEQQICRLAQIEEVKQAAKSVEQRPKNSALHPVPQSQPARLPTKPSQPFEGPDYLNDRSLSLYLEPIVDFVSMQTMFYRAELAFQSTKGNDKIRISDMTNQIVADGRCEEMDMKLLNQLGPVINRLAQKGRLAGVICPMSQHSFSNQNFLEELTHYLKYYPELAKVLVIEISQANLANLSQDGMAGLAFLAQIGATFCLGGAGLESPDLNSLSSLGFRYFDLDIKDNIARYGKVAFEADGLGVHLCDQAIAAEIQLIGSGLTLKGQRDELRHVLHFGRGTLFSRPRLVRSDFATPRPVGQSLPNNNVRSKAA